MAMELFLRIGRTAWVQYMNSRSLEENLDLLRTEMQELDSRQTDLIIALHKANVEDGKKPKAEVSLWLENVDKITSQMTKIEEDCRVRRDSLASRVQLGNLVIKKIEEVMKLKEKGQFSEGLLADLLSEMGIMPTTKLVGKTTAERNLEQIWESLRDHEVRSIGVYGMGGVGKTTIMTHIYNRIKKSGIFGIVIWVTVSNDSSVERLQNGIAQAIGLNLSNEQDEMRRSMKLFEALKRREKLVVIFDDVWNSFSLQMVGIAEDMACKIVFTTRSKNVCRAMNCQKTFEVKVLSTEEAWELFKEKLGVNVVLSSEVEQIAKLVTKECAGLPLGIITVASAMREKNDIREWRNALEELQCSTMDIEGMDDKVFRILKFSYDRLKSEKIRSCFLYCALFPEDYEISPAELVSYWMAEGLIDDMGDWKKEADKGHAILNGLIDVCMLLTRRHNGPKVVMHDLIRDLAIGITRKSPRFVVQAGIPIRRSIRVEEFNEDADRISFMTNKIKKLPGEPNWPKLSTLFLQKNPLSDNISHEFFNRMNSLRVLDLSYTEIEYLPASVSNLENLHALLLSNCQRLKDVPSLAKLKRLRILNLSNTLIKEVPDGMECLVNLKELYLVFYGRSAAKTNVVSCNSLVLPDSIVKLKMERCDLSSLPFLSHLPIRDDSNITSLPSIQSLDLKGLPNLRGLCEGALLPGTFACLTHMKVSGCQVLENLMSLELFQHLQCLRLMRIENCSEMEEVIKGGEEAMVEEEGYNSINNNTIILPNLRDFQLADLGKLKSICKQVIICPSLNWIGIQGCPRLKKIPLSLGDSTSVLKGHIKGSKEWWDALEWDDPNTKTLFQPLFQGLEGRRMKRRAEEESEEVASTSQQR
ncbi:putative disease resistance protein At4g10780 [Magnolia sinica]|uniref:putative disease resistance protein At4g10780 n=1 Tax=Magnolia sinica TaxID=86752 RepID=UPI0026588D03|nr:putative disease resistance protein At4g10780 [Magnolia sinica]